MGKEIKGGKLWIKTGILNKLGRKYLRNSRCCAQFFRRRTEKFLRWRRCDLSET
jgi:hypothetical protein